MEILKILCAIGLVLSMCSCSNDQSEIQEVIKSQLNDPSSAIFKEFTKSDDDVACIAYNAKNGFGGYGDWAYGKLIKKQSKWIVLNLKENQEYCSQEYFDIRDEYISLTKEVIKDKKRPDEILQICSEALNMEKTGDRNIPLSMYKDIISHTKKYLDKSR